MPSAVLLAVKIQVITMRIRPFGTRWHSSSIADSTTYLPMVVAEIPGSGHTHGYDKQ